jgi:hypothetical protein
MFFIGKCVDNEDKKRVGPQAGGKCRMEKQGQKKSPFAGAFF